MKIAYLILAHNQPNHLSRMINTLNSENVSFYVHIDRKSDISPFNLSQYPENVFFLENRITVTHGGFSMVDAIIRLMIEALKDNGTEYFIFLTGWDYPIKDNKSIFNFLSNSYPMNFLNFYPLVGDANLIKNIQRYYFIDFIGQFPKPIRIPLKIIQYLIQTIPLNRKFIPGMTPYRGSSSFCLNRTTVAYIIEFVNSEKWRKYIDFFKFVSCADEIFFHTIILNSPNAAACRFYERDIINSKTPMKNENKAYLHYIDWNSKRENPAQLDMTDLEKLMSSDALFARKFNEVKSRQLLESIDQTLKA